ncbi:hypothetical protein JCM5353_004284 [Sporobolomyces roseus]
MSNSLATSTVQPNSYCFSLVIKLCKRLKAFDTTLAQAQLVSAEVDRAIDRKLDLILKAGVLRIPCVYVEKPKLNPPYQTSSSWNEAEEDEVQEKVPESASKHQDTMIPDEPEEQATLALTQPRATRFDVGSIPRNNRDREKFFFGSTKKKEGVEQVKAKEKLRDEFELVLDGCEKLSEDIVEVVLDLVLESARMKSGTKQS